MATLNSIQTFNYNKFPQPHTDLAACNMGIAYPLGFIDCPVGSIIENSIDIFARSSALIDPSFLDCEINVGHYFVSYEAMDYLYRLRIQQFKGTNMDVALPTTFFAPTSGDQDKIMAVGSLADFLGFSYDTPSAPATNFGTISLSVYPFLAYHMIIDHFFRNSRIQDVERTKKLFLAAFPSLDDTSISAQSLLAPMPEFFDLDYVNFEPDRFTTSRPAAGGPSVQIPGIGSDDSVEGTLATIHNLLDAMLIQKVSDMIERGGYSYNDFIRIIYGQEPRDEASEYPVFLGGSSSALQVSTVVNQTAPAESATATTALGAEGGRVSSYLSNDNRFTYHCMRPGIYMPLIWIRPATYYRSGISKSFERLSTVASGLIPQLADLQDEPIYRYEVSADPYYMQTESQKKTIFGYQDRYQDYRTKTNRVIGSMRTQRKGWYINRPIPGNTAPINAEFLNMSTVTYSPWVVTDSSESHFFLRADHDLTVTLPLPRISKPYVW